VAIAVLLANIEVQATDSMLTPVMRERPAPTEKTFGTLRILAYAAPQLDCTASTGHWTVLPGMYAKFIGLPLASNPGPGSC
jgi:hypothetical protein